MFDKEWELQVTAAGSEDKQYRSSTKHPDDILGHLLTSTKSYWVFVEAFSISTLFLMIHVSLSPADIRCGWEPDGAWWVHCRGEADWNVVEAPGCWWRSWSGFTDVHCAAGPAQSHDAGNTTKSSFYGTEVGKVCPSFQTLGDMETGQIVSGTLWKLLSYYLF